MFLQTRIRNLIWKWPKYMLF